MPSRKSIGRKRIKKIWFFVLVFFAPWSFGIEIDIDARCRAVLLHASLSAQRTGNSFPFQRHGSEWTELHKAIRDLEIKPLDAQNPSWDTFRTLLDRRVRLNSELFHDWYKLVGEIVYRDRGLPQKSGEPFANANVSDRLFEWFNKDKAAWNSPQNARAIAKGIGRQNKLILDSVLRSRQEIDRGLEAFRQVVLRQKGLLSALLVQGAGLPSSARGRFHRLATLWKGLHNKRVGIPLRNQKDCKSRRLPNRFWAKLYALGGRDGQRAEIDISRHGRRHRLRSR